MKLEVFRLAVLLKVIFLIVPCFADDNVREIRLDWKTKSTDGSSEVSFNFQRVQLIRGSLKFEVIAHNLHKESYACIFVTAGENTMHMDDEFGGEYKGATVSFERGLDNKLALNQKKIFTISIPAPEKGVSLVNLHFGLSSYWTEPEAKCENPLVNSGYNFHQLNWDVSWIK